MLISHSDSFLLIGQSLDVTVSGTEVDAMALKNPGL